MINFPQDPHATSRTRCPPPPRRPRRRRHARLRVALESAAPERHDRRGHAPRAPRDGALPGARLSRRRAVGLGGADRGRSLARELDPQPAPLRLRSLHRRRGAPLPPDVRAGAQLGTANARVGLRPDAPRRGLHLRVDRLRHGVGQLRGAARARGGAPARRPSGPLGAAQPPLRRGPQLRACANIRRKWSAAATRKRSDVYR